MDNFPGTDGSRTQADYKDLGHSLIENHLKTVKAKTVQPSAPTYHQIAQFVTTTIWKWVYHYTKNRFGFKAKYQEYTSQDTGVYKLPAEEEIRIGVVGDWATDTMESSQVAAKMGSHDPHYTIHIGDTYFVGEPREIKANFLLPGSPWVKGSKGSFALLGNHEMYARGIGYFRDLLPTMGLRDEAGVFKGQGASYFCLENENWRILGLDTGYHSIGSVPFLEMWSLLTPDGRFHDKLMNWLENVVKIGDPADNRGILILTHHPCITTFNRKKEYLKAANQLASLLKTDKKVLWLCGHEHKFSIYEKIRLEKTLSAYVRCIGNGGMPVELRSNDFVIKDGSKGSGHLVMVDDRVNPENPEGFGYNGYAMIKILANRLIIEYYDHNEILISESWTNDTGNLAGTISNHHPKLKHLAGKTWIDAVKE